MGTGLIIHKGIVKSGSFSIGDVVSLEVEMGLRRSVVANHSCKSEGVTC